MYSCSVQGITAVFRIQSFGLGTEVTHLHSDFEVCQQLGPQSCAKRLGTGILHSSCPIPILAGVALLYALNAANPWAIDTILFAPNMIGSEEGCCLAMATKPNKNLNSSCLDLWRRVWCTRCPTMSNQPDQIHQQVNLGLSTKEKRRSSLFVVLGYQCRNSTRSKRGFFFQHRLHLGSA